MSTAPWRPMETFREVLNLHLKHRSALGYCLVSLLTVGGERIFSTTVFQCPCSAAWNLPYGLIFLLVPALALFLLGYMLNPRTWRVLTGCCSRGCRERQRGACVCLSITGTAAVAPLTWVAVALLGGTFYECAASGSEFVARRLCNTSCSAQLPLVPCQQAQEPDMKQLQKELQKVLTAQSQVLGWILIAIVFIFLLIFTSASRCLSPVSCMQLKFWKIYLQEEQQIFKIQATEHAAQLAKENVKSFFEYSHPKKYNTPSIEDWRKISSLYTFNPKEQYYSALHKYVNQKQKNQSSTSSEEGEVFSVLGFVDSAHMNSLTDL